MTLEDYCAINGRGTMKRIAERSGVSYTMVRLAARGLRIVQADTALAISKATDGEVSIEELLFPNRDAA